MDYTQFFRNLREARGLTLDQLADLAHLHRNTVVNIESGRPVKFKTIAELMRKMGYAAGSPELRSIALLWLESVSGLPFSRPETEQAARKSIQGHRAATRQTTALLDDVVARNNLTADQIRLLIFAAENPGVLAILDNVRDLLAAPAAGKARPPLLEAAEDRATYGEH